MKVVNVCTKVFRLPGMDLDGLVPKYVCIRRPRRMVRRRARQDQNNTHEVSSSNVCRDLFKTQAIPRRSQRMQGGTSLGISHLIYPTMSLKLRQTHLINLGLPFASCMQCTL